MENKPIINSYCVAERLYAGESPGDKGQEKAKDKLEAFLEFGLAYGLETSWANESDYKYDATSHSLQVPALLGVSVGRDIGANFYVGPYLDFTVASKSEMEIFGEKSVTRLRDLEDYNRFQLGLKLGAEFDLDVFVIGVNYSLGLTSRTKGADATGSKLMFYFAF